MLVETAGDADALARGIIQILSSSKLAITFRTRGLERVKSYTWDRLASKLEQEFQKLL
jgi:glycosyltransferase involved in cell wall biosynthesis